MTAYAFTRLVHIFVAVLGMGSITANAFLARTSDVSPMALRTLTRVASGAIALMIVSGLLLDYFVAGAFHRATWFRVAVVGTVAAGIAIAVARRAIGQAITGKAETEAARRRAARAMWFAVTLVAFIVVDMVRKPFA